MAVTPNSAILPQTPRSGVAQIANADGTNLKMLLTGAANATKVSAVIVSNTDTLGNTAQLVHNIGGTNTGGTISGGTNYVLASATLPASAGNVGGTPPVSLFATANLPGLPLDQNGSSFLYLNSGEFLCVALTGAVTAGKVVSAHAIAADY